MEKKLLEGRRAKLEHERVLLLDEIKRSERTVDFGADIDHFDEETDEAEELGNQMALSQDLKNRLEDIDHALEKIREGKYGLCEKCGSKIQEEVLDVDPESRLCKHCKAGK